jgi:hypothetical protein
MVTFRRVFEEHMIECRSVAAILPKLYTYFCRSVQADSGYFITIDEHCLISNIYLFGANWHFGVAVTIYDFYSGGSQIESGPRHELFWVIFGVPPSLSKEIPG